MAIVDTFNFDPTDYEVDHKPRGDTGYCREIQERDTTKRLRGLGVSREFPRELYVDPADWKEMARDNDENRAWAEDNRARFTNQGAGNGRRGTHECTCHSLLQGFEAARNATMPGLAKYQVKVSALSIYAEANPGKWGGAGCIEVLNIASRRGFLPEKHGDTFRHYLHGTNGAGNKDQSSGDWVAVRDFPDGWKDTARHFRVLEAIVVTSIEQAVSLLLHGRVINVGRRGHAVPWNRVAWKEGSRDPFDGLYFPYPDSYDVIRADSLATARGALSGASCIWSVTIPDDLARPVGEDGGTL